MRSAHTATLILALLAGFLEAPFAHMHELGGSEDHHSSQQAHVHARVHARNSDGLVLLDSDPADDAVATDWFQAAPYVEWSFYVLPTQISVPQPVEDTEFPRLTPAVRNHDPPCFWRLPARAPPSIPA